MTIGPIIRTLRAEAGLTQEQLGKKAGMVQAAIARLESGRTDPTFKTVNRIAEALGKRIVFL